MTLTAPVSSTEVIRLSAAALNSYRSTDVTAAISQMAMPCHRGSVGAFAKEEVLTYLINVPSDWQRDDELKRGIDSIVAAGSRKRQFNQLVENARAVLEKSSVNERRMRRRRSALSTEHAAAFLLLQQLAASSS